MKQSSEWKWLTILLWRNSITIDYDKGYSEWYKFKWRKWWCNRVTISGRAFSRIILERRRRRRLRLLYIQCTTGVLCTLAHRTMPRGPHRDGMTHRRRATYSLFTIEPINRLADYFTPYVTVSVSHRGCHAQNAFENNVSIYPAIACSLHGPRRAGNNELCRNYIKTDNYY